MITPITATFPALNFPKESDYPTQNDWADFSAAAELNYGILSGEWSLKSELYKNQMNTLAQQIQEIGENAINAITLDTIEDLATYTGTGLVIVKDINRGGTFVYKTAIEIDPNTGELYEANNGTVFAGNGGFWARQYSKELDSKWFAYYGDKTKFEVELIEQQIPVMNKEFVKNGKGIYDSRYSVNFLEKYALYGNESYKIGRINSGRAFEWRKDKIYNICILGDSISVGSDYSTESSMSGLYEWTGADLNPLMGLWADHFIQSLVAKGVRFNLYNRSIPGQSLNSLDSTLSTLPNKLTGRYLVDDTKTWYENIEVLQPDLVIVAHGMNHSSEGNSFSENLHSKFYLPAKTSGWLKDVAILTVPNPNYNTTVSYGNFSSFNNNASKFLIQLQQRAWAREYGAYIVDVGNLSNLYRYGISVNEKTGFLNDTNFATTDGSNSIIFNGGYPSNPNYSTFFTSDNLSIEGKVTFSLELDSIFINDPINNYFRIVINNTTLVTVKSNSISISNGGLYGGAGSLNRQKNTSFTLPSTCQVSVQYTEYLIRVFIDNINILSLTNPNFGYPKIEIQNIGTGTVSVTSSSKTSIQYAKYKNVLASDEVFNASSNSSDWGNKLPYGGAVNHPSLIGLTNLYLPAITEFINDIKINRTPVFTEEQNISSFAGFKTVASYGYLKDLYDLSIKQENINNTITSKIVSTMIGEEMHAIVFNRSFTGSLGFNIRSEQKLELTFEGKLLSNKDKIGYGSGSTSSITQTTSKSTAVTINNPAGRIVTANSPMAVGEKIGFVMNNTFMKPNDVLIVSPSGISGYRIYVDYVSNGTSRIIIENTKASSASDSITINFSIFHIS